MKDIPRVDILGCPFDAISFGETVAVIEKTISSKRKAQIVPGSIDFVMKARKDPAFKDNLWRAELVIADGVPIVWAATLLGNPIKGRVSGTDLVWQCARLSGETGCPIALIGGRYEYTRKAAEVMAAKHKNSKIYPIHTPFPLSPEDNRKIIAEIVALKAGIVLVALGAPKQEAWVNQNLGACGAFIGIGVGSAFDIISGAVPRAPWLLREYGFEWLHRMISEPHRLAKRYLVQDMPFIFYLSIEAIKRLIR